MSKYGFFSGPYFRAFGLNTERYFVSLRIQCECGKIRTRKSSVFGHISHNVRFRLFRLFRLLRFCITVYSKSFKFQTSRFQNKFSVKEYVSLIKSSGYEKNQPNFDSQVYNIGKQPKLTFFNIKIVKHPRIEQLLIPCLNLC